MPEKPTHAEQRSATADQRELIEITDEMRVMMEEKRREASSEVDRYETEETREEAEYNFREYEQRQDFFVTVSKRQFLETGHPAAIIDRVVERLDLSRLYEKYSHEGNPSYHPKMMLKVLFYAYYCGIMSCRTIWEQVVNRADFIYLAAGQVPNFRTINSFRLRHLEELSDLFTQIVYLCKELEMIGFEHLAVDGQKIKANANFRKSKNRKGLQKEYEKTKLGVEKLLAKEVNEEFPREVKEKRKERLEKKLDQLEGFRKKLEALGDEEQRLNMSDEDAKVMRHKDGSSTPSYTHQSAVDEKYGVVTAVETTQSNDTPGDLLPLVDDSKKNSGGGHEVVTADCGFCDYETLETVEQKREEEFYLPDRRYEQSKKEGKKKFRFEDFREEGEGSYRCPAGKTMERQGTVKNGKGDEMVHYVGIECEDCPLKSKCTTGKRRHLYVDTREPYRKLMREKLDSEKGREIYMKRQGIVEPGHGDDQKNRKWVQHHLRGLEKAAAEFLLVRIATNLSKIIKFKTDELLALCPG
jgi:transposase